MDRQDPSVVRRPSPQPQVALFRTAYPDLDVPKLARMLDRRCRGYKALDNRILLPATAMPTTWENLWMRCSTRSCSRCRTGKVRDETNASHEVNQRLPLAESKPWMSEYQYVAFRAIDRPVGEKNLEYMHRQSSRAEITPWSFENEYHYGDFRGNAAEMLRRGYDIHLHYANFGIRKLLIRLPGGLPNAHAIKPYIAKDSLQFLQDKQGLGGSLSIEPFHDGGELDELWEIDAIFDRLVPLRAEILDGDLRPLYLAHLAVACDGEHDSEDTREAPVPAGLEALSDAQRGLAELFGLGDALIAAAARESPPMPSRVDSAKGYSKWLRVQSESTKNAWLGTLMTDPSSAVRAEILEKYRTDQSVPGLLPETWSVWYESS